MAKNNAAKYNLLLVLEVTKYSNIKDGIKSGLNIKSSNCGLKATPDGLPARISTTTKIKVMPK